MQSARECPYCRGEKVMRDTAGEQPTLRVLCDCVDCRGQGVVCTFCGQPEGVCECVRVVFCPECGLPPWGCRCPDRQET